MKRILFLAAALLLTTSLTAQQPAIVYTEASDLTLTGKLFPDTPNPYHRLDTVRFKGFTPKENEQVRNSSGIAVAFRTDARSLTLLTRYGYKGFPTNTNGISARGFDLYIRRDGQWVYAASNVPSDAKLEKPFTLIKAMPAGVKECLLYLPLYSEEYSVKIGVEQGAMLEPLPNPFRHRIGVFGSSYTHGSSSSRPGMTWPAQFSRNTGLQLLSLGCSGNSKLQDYFAAALAEADVEAFLFDSFSNPNPTQMRERLFPFIETIQAAHPGKPLIFQRTIWREGRNFCESVDRSEVDKMHTADSLMAIACARYKDVYYIRPNACTDKHDASIDGTHPSNHGYRLWAESIEKPVRRILRKYGIR